MNFKEKFLLKLKEEEAGIYMLDKNTDIVFDIKQKNVEKIILEELNFLLKNYDNNEKIINFKNEYLFNLIIMALNYNIDLTEVLKNKENQSILINVFSLNNERLFNKILPHDHTSYSENIYIREINYDLLVFLH